MKLKINFEDIFQKFGMETRLIPIVLHVLVSLSNSVKNFVPGIILIKLFGIILFNHSS